MYGAILLELGHPQSGREEQAFELVNEFFERVQKALADGRLAGFHWYGLEDGDLSVRAAIVALEAPPDALDAFATSDEFRELRYAAPSFLQGFRVSRARPPDALAAGESFLTRVLHRWGLVQR
jgi:hypothetical protein